MVFCTKSCNYSIFIRLGNYDYLLTGSGVVVDFKTPTGEWKILHIKLYEY